MKAWRPAIAGLGGMLGMAVAEVPTIDAFFPAGCQIGAECVVKAEGKMEPWPPKVWTDHEGLTFTPDAKEKGGFVVRVDENMTPGAHLARFYNAEGASAPRIFVVGGDQEIAETEPANDLLHPGSIPIIVNGKFNPGEDIDRFPVRLKAGESFVAEILAYAIDSPVDPLLHVRDSQNAQIAFNHDATTIGLDPRIEFTASEDGTYTLLASGFAYPPKADVRFGGGNTTVYRLRFEHPPPAIERAPEPERIAVPGKLSGWIGTHRERDRYAFDARKGETLRIEVRAAPLGSLLDPSLRILGSDGKVLARGDDINAKTDHDAALDWKAPADGAFVAEIHDLNRMHGERYYYQLEITRPEPHIDATAAAHALTVKAGEKTEFKIKATRKYGFAEKVSAAFESLPQGVTAKPVEVPEKGGEITLVLEAAADAPASSQPISVRIGDAIVTHSIKGAHADAGDLLINETSELWLTVIAKK